MAGLSLLFNVGLITRFYEWFAADNRPFRAQTPRIPGEELEALYHSLLG